MVLKLPAFQAWQQMATFVWEEPERGMLRSKRYKVEKPMSECCTTSNLHQFQYYFAIRIKTEYFTYRIHHDRSFSLRSLKDKIYLVLKY